MFELLGTTTNSGRTLLKDKSLDRLRQRAKGYRCNGYPLRHYAIYKAYMFPYGRFHNATDERFLVEHWQDPYWLNCGVPSIERSDMPCNTV